MDDTGNGTNKKYKIVDELEMTRKWYRFKFVWWCNITNGSTLVYLWGDETTAHPKNTTAKESVADIAPLSRHIYHFGVGGILRTGQA